MSAGRMQSGLEIVGSFLYIHEADLARALLESEGLRAWILDDHQVRMEWHMATALGGVKVAVVPEDSGRARQILSEDRSADLESIPELQLPAAEGERCPACYRFDSSLTRSLGRPGALQLGGSLLLLALGFLVPRRTIVSRRTCRACGHEWSYTQQR